MADAIRYKPTSLRNCPTSHEADIFGHTLRQVTISNPDSHAKKTHDKPEFLNPGCKSGHGSLNRRCSETAAAMPETWRCAEHVKLGANIKFGAIRIETYRGEGNPSFPIPTTATD